jgi:restriction endonuclease S subunit
MELREVATVIAGYAFRGAIKPDVSGATSVFQAKDLVQGEPFDDTASLTRISHELPGYSGHLRKNDVLLVARGMKSGAFRSTVFTADDLNVVASSSVHVIRITSSEVLPEYISLFLNSREGQSAVASIVTGSYIGAVPRRELEKIKIPKLPLSKQRSLVNLSRNIEEQQKILERKKQIRQNIINATFSSLTK